MLKHDTAGVYLFHHGPDGKWRIGLIEHPRLHRWMIPGGHVDPGESHYDAALRELAEETGILHVNLLPGDAPRFPADFPEDGPRPLPLPWWITDMQVPPDGNLDADHHHVDHQYVATVIEPTPSSDGEHPFAWYTEQNIAALTMFEDSRALARGLFRHLTEPDPPRKSTIGLPGDEPLAMSAFVDPRRTSRLINALSDQTDATPANRARDPEALLWGRATKVSEEAGEVIQALSGALGHNHRKGVHGSLADVEYELLDVALAALCSVSHLHSRHGETSDPLDLLAHHAQSVARRGGLADIP